MQDYYKYQKRLFFIFLVILSLVVPMGETAFASPNNEMINNEWLQNSENDDQRAPIQTDEQKGTELTGGQGLSVWDYLKMIFALIFVLALLLFVLKFINKKSLNNRQHSLVRNLGGVNLGSQKSIQLLQIGKSIYVVGVGENVQLMKEIENPEDIEQLINNFNEHQTFNVTSPYLLELFNKMKSKIKNTEEEQDKQNSFGEIFNKRLSEIKKNRQNELEKWKEKERDK